MKPLGHLLPLRLYSLGYLFLYLSLRKSIFLLPSRMLTAEAVAELFYRQVRSLEGFDSGWIYLLDINLKATLATFPNQLHPPT